MFEAFLEAWKNPWIRWIGFRYLRSKKSSGFLSLITYLSVGGVGVGVTATIVVLSVMEGFEQELEKRLMSSDLHILIEPSERVAGFSGGRVPSDAFPAEVVQALKNDPEIKELRPVLATEAVMRYGRRVSGIVLKGIQPDQIDGIREKLIEEGEESFFFETVAGERIRRPGVWIGQELAQRTQLAPGDRLTLISPSELYGPFASVPRLKRVVVEGVYQTGLPDQERYTVYSRSRDIENFLRERGVLSQWEVVTRDFHRADRLASKYQKLLPDFRVQGWGALNASLFASLRLERLAMAIVTLFTIVVASFNIVTTLTLMVIEKKKEIAILKAMGARNAQVGAIFLAEGMIIGTVGVGGGVALAGLLSFLLDRYEIVTLPDIYYDRTLPVSFEPFYYYGAAGIALAVVLFASVWPGRRAARLIPLDGIRQGS